MSDFDIANLNRNNYATSMQKRKALGLDDSDSEDETPKRQTKKVTPVRKERVIEHKIPIKEIQETETNTYSNTIEINSSIIDEDMIAAEALMAQPIQISQVIDTSINDNFIDLSDEEGIEDEISIPDVEIEGLEPELIAVLNESTNESTIQPIKVTVRLHYVHNYKLISEKAKEVVQTLMKPVKVILMDNEQFRKVLGSYCRKKSLKSSEVILTFNDDQIFLTGTPAGLGMNDTEIYNMNVYPIKCYNDMLEQKKQQKIERFNRLKTIEVEQDEEFIAPALPLPVEENDSADKIMVKLRGNDKKDIHLRVKPTSTLASLVNSYKQHAGVTGNLNLSFEGEILDLNQTIEETELEDDDLIEVV